MAQKTYDGRVMHKRDASANWTSNDPVLLNGEIIIVDTQSGETRLKIGDGMKKYTQIPFEDEAVRSLIANKADAEHSHDTATQTTAGFMGTQDKIKLDGVAENANNYVHPTAPGSKHIPAGGASGQILRWSANGEAVWGNEGVTNHAAAEVATGGRWVDGRPIYRLSGMYAGPLTNGAQNDFPLGIAPIHTVIRADVFTRGAPADGSSGYWWFPATYNNATSGNVNYSISYLINNCHSDPSLRVIVSSGMDVRGRQLAYCIEYTKAADIPTYYHLPYLATINDQGCVVSASSEFSSAYYMIYAFGGSVNGRYWACLAADAERWIQVQMPYKLKNMIVRLTNPIGGGSEAQYMPVAGTFQGSNDGSAWTQLGAFADRPTTAGGVTEHALNNAEAYKYLRVQVTQPGAGSWTGFGDIRVQGEVEAETDS